MSRAQDKDVNEGDVRADEPPGKVEFDSRGKAIWRWARDKLDSTSVLLKRLENQNLALEPTRKVPVIGGKASPSNAAPSAAGQKAKHERAPGAAEPRTPFGRSKPGDRGGGFDPYNSR